MRISTGTLSENAIFNTQRASERVFRAQQSVGSGRRLSELSDDPRALPDDLLLHATVDNIAQYRKNLDDAQGFVGASDIAVGNALTVIRRARVIAVQGASDGITTQDREDLATQVEALTESLATVANTSFGNRFLFSGQRTTTEPFSLQSGGYVYRGGSRATGDANLQFESGPRQPITVNKPGDDVFGAAFQALKDLKSNLLIGQPARISQDSLPQIDKVLDGLAADQADYGAKTQHIKEVGDRYTQMENDAIGLLSNIEDVDIPSAIVELTTAQTAYQAALTATTRSFQQSLLDFLK